MYRRMTFAHLHSDSATVTSYIIKYQCLCQKAHINQGLAAVCVFMFALKAFEDGSPAYDLCLSFCLFRLSEDDRDSPPSSSVSSSSSSSSLCSGHTTLPVTFGLPRRWPPTFTPTEKPLPSGCRKQQHNRWQKRLQFFFLSVFHLLFFLRFIYISCPVFVFVFLFNNSPPHNRCCQCVLLFPLVLNRLIQQTVVSELWLRGRQQNRK